MILRTGKILLVMVAGTGILAVFLLVAGEFWQKPVRAMSNPLPRPLFYGRMLLYSPGDLAKGHQGIDCSKCHQPFQRIDDQGCRKCHTAKHFQSITTGAVLDTHLVFLKKDQQIRIETNSLCLACHREHQGGQPRILRSLKEVGHDGLTTKKILCLNCHRSQQDYHENMINDRCQECHSVNTWESPFSHRKVSKITVYLQDPTKGKKNLHDELCGSCHPAGWHQEGGNSRQFVISGNFDCLFCHRL